MPPPPGLVLPPLPDLSQANANNNEAVRVRIRLNRAKQHVAEIERELGEELAAREGEATYWRLITKPAPEVCTECGAGWLHATGIGLVDDRVVGLNVSWIGDLETVVGDDDPPPISDLLDRAVRGAACG